MSLPELMFCRRYHTKMTQVGCDNFRANSPERCVGCAGMESCDQPEDVAVTPVAAPEQEPTRKHAPLVPSVWPKRPKKETPREGKEEAVAKNRKVQACAKCGREMLIIARDLCGKCYYAEKGAGTLDANFPSSHPLANKSEARKPKEPAEPPGKRNDAVAKKAESSGESNPCACCGDRPSASSRGLCVRCYNRHVKAGTLDAEYPSPHGMLVEKRAKRGDRAESILESVSDGKQPQKAERPAGVKTDPPSITVKDIDDLSRTPGVIVPDPPSLEKYPCLVIEFVPKDQELYDTLVILAENNRRSLDQEILYRLENGRLD